MNSGNIKIGDKVLITKPANADADAHSSWVTEMNQYNGIIATISKINTYSIRIKEDSSTWNYYYADGHYKLLTEPTYELW